MYPCHFKPKEDWCDWKGTADFMGHTCTPKNGESHPNNIPFEFEVVPKSAFITGVIQAEDLGEAIYRMRHEFPADKYEMVRINKERQNH